MSQAQAIWDIVLTAAERDERIREALRASLPVPTDTGERGLPKIMRALHEGAVSAMPQPEDGDITGSASAIPQRDRAASPAPAAVASGGWGRGDR